ncbi:response regulator [Labrys wisconsinensis]|uniref:histidine kinase n=1 Tax=Labrys wisconsinensis TaxID=425677 RepID=A0ABU0JHM2_9HYPH|nr:response regulator [Labrys wisconsinensis]MDQ0473778.1 PAS domain S-box-containing protein [Labrys wisconsinensis]
MPVDAESLALIVMTAITAVAAGAAVVLVRDALRSRRRVAALQAEVERQGDLIWDLREAEERARSLLDGQGDLIVRRSGQGAITYANDAFCALAGRPREELTGTLFDFAKDAPATRETREGGVTRRVEAIRTAGGMRWIEWQDMAVRGAVRGQPELQSVGRDVTAHREAGRAAAQARDAAEAANRAKSQFLATVTHEIRTPMGGILGMADLLIDTRLTPDQATYARAIKSSGEALLSLIDEILDFSKIEAGRLDLDEKPFILASLIEDAAELLAPRAHAKGIEIAAAVAADLPMRVRGDAGRLKQVLLNLAGNAIKFTEAGGVIVRAVRQGGDVAFSVEDTGIGIAPEKLGVIFREFEQAESGSTRRFGGTGLGLAISQRLVERMGGRIGVESRPGAGSTFRFALALPPADGEIAAGAAAGGRRVLVASPSPIVGPALTAMLAGSGFPVTVATDAARAAELVAAEPFGTVLADRSFGLEATAALAARGLAAGRRVVALVTPAERPDLARLTAAGAAGYLIKPVRAASLLAQVAGRMPALPANDDAEPAPTRPLAGLTVLLAEDNEVNALVARTVLAKLGAEVVWATDGREAVAAHARRRFDAVLMDMHMPGLDGPGAARAIRAAEAAQGLARIPIHALTANMRQEDRDACRAAGMDDFLVKPFDSDDLVALLRPQPPPARSA